MFIYTCIYTCMHRVDIDTTTNDMRVCVYECVCICVIYICMPVYVCASGACVCVYVCAFAPACLKYPQGCIYTHIHT